MRKILPRDLAPTLCVQDENSTLFLVAAYQRYSCPYVWVRTNHERLVRLSGDGDRDRDNPLKLRSTQRWLKDGEFCSAQGKGCLRGEV